MGEESSDPVDWVDGDNGGLLSDNGSPMSMSTSTSIVSITFVLLSPLILLIAIIEFVILLLIIYIRTCPSDLYREVVSIKDGLFRLYVHVHQGSAQDYLEMVKMRSDIHVHTCTCTCKIFFNQTINKGFIVVVWSKNDKDH